jgi:hypothetical protein
MSPHTPKPTDGGFTLPETLIALVLTLVVIGGAVDTFIRSTELIGGTRVISETNHGLQAGMSLMVRDLIQAGQGIPLGGIPIPSGGGAQQVRRPGATAGLQFPATPTLPALTPGADLGPTLLGVATDMVTILYADRTLPIGQFPLQNIAVDGSSMTVNPATPVTGVGGIQAGDLILFSNALGFAVQTVTQTPTSQLVLFATNDTLRFNQRAAPQGTIMNLQSAPGVFPPTTATRIFLISYYIDTVTDPTLPRLVRRVNDGPPLAIVMGAENLQFTFDVVDGVTNPNNVATLPVGSSPNQIRKANLFLSARSLDPSPQTKAPFRNSMATQVGLRSLSFVDRYR